MKTTSDDLKRELKKTIEATARIVLASGRVIYTPVWTDGNGIFCLFRNVPHSVRRAAGGPVPEHREVNDEAI